MSRNYKATGINLKSMPLGETDRLITLLTPERGLIRVVAPGARKPKSKLGGRTALFVVNELVLAKGRSLDRITQAETLTSYPKLSQTLAKLTVGQYLAEVVLYQALGDQPQGDLFELLCQQLAQLEQVSLQAVPALLIHSLLHLLTWAGIAPQVQACCDTQVPLPTEPGSYSPVALSPRAGGTVLLEPLVGCVGRPFRLAEPSAPFAGLPRRHRDGVVLGEAGLHLLQAFAAAVATEDAFVLLEDALLFEKMLQTVPLTVWLSVERALRQYLEYYLERPIRSAALIETCFPTDAAVISVNP
ncbi:DNA repair protein RecO [Synechococcales cyanobacterium C]|uniref:DNA repair protein RecO n=1 Tax=Petrachloros mirabilis ULC683 TaxID=2781853 RepID=A0A8K1ZYZ6_9CYAN|nr:DNA repair protein RecO [Petrachloros mirabilis]NCJ06548.1 DNA repair protein RecO [Petrachloros mirabilis ULC683]